jgi:hypothetical protein
MCEYFRLLIKKLDFQNKFPSDTVYNRGQPEAKGTGFQNLYFSIIYIKTQRINYTKL